jgi:hypothetical protein
MTTWQGRRVDRNARWYNSANRLGGWPGNRWRSAIMIRLQARNGNGGGQRPPGKGDRSQSEPAMTQNAQLSTGPIGQHLCGLFARRRLITTGRAAILPERPACGGG